MLSFLISSSFADCQTYKYRKSVFDMDQSEIEKWQSGHMALYNNGVLQEMTRIHGTYQTIHDNAHLWAWHREFLNWYEEELLKVNPETVLPYFPWIYDAEVPELSKVWNEDILGGSNVQWDGRDYQAVCVPNGPFTRIVDNQGQCLQRQFDKQGHTGFPQDLLYQIGKQPTRPDLLKIQLYGESSYEQWLNTADPNQFVSLLDVPHFLVHLFVGGSQRWFSSSCFDGLFWLHHSFMDFILDDWLKMHPDQVQNWPQSDWKLDYFGKTTKEVLETDYCVRYIRPVVKGSGNKPSPGTSPIPGQGTSDRVIPMIPEQPMVKMGMNIKSMQKSYNENKKIIVITKIKGKYGSKKTTNATPGMDQIIDTILASVKINLNKNDVALIKNVAKDLTNWSDLPKMISEFVEALKIGQSEAGEKLIAENTESYGSSDATAASQDTFSEVSSSTILKMVIYICFTSLL